MGAIYLKSKAQIIEAKGNGSKESQTSAKRHFGTFFKNMIFQREYHSLTNYPFSIVRSDEEESYTAS